jgi:hypothetical protein
MPAWLFWSSVNKTVYTTVSYSNTFAPNLAVVPSIFSLYTAAAMTINGKIVSIQLIRRNRYSVWIVLILCDLISSVIGYQP